MPGYHFDCHEKADGVKCTKTLSADTKEELLKESLHHLSEVHGLNESLGLKDRIRARIKRGKKVA